jgi:hypothetical protein
MINIPIYRAKEKYNENYIEGFYTEIDGRGYIVNSINKSTEIDQETLAINFKKMKTKNGKKIFASLNANGIGGDKIEFFKEKEYIKEAIFIFDVDACTNPTVELLGLASSEKEKNEYYTVDDHIINIKIKEIHK